LNQNTIGIRSMPASLVQRKFAAKSAKRADKKMRANSAIEDATLDDEALLVAMEVRLSAESGADAMNEETFGDCSGGWSFEEAAAANAMLAEVEEARLRCAEQENNALLPSASHDEAVLPTSSLRKDAPSFVMPGVDWAKVVDSVCIELSELESAPKTVSHSVSWLHHQFQQSGSWPVVQEDLCVCDADVHLLPPLRPHPTFFAELGAPIPDNHKSSTFEYVAKKHQSLMKGSSARISSSSTEDFTSSSGSSVGDQCDVEFASSFCY